MNDSWFNLPVAKLLASKINYRVFDKQPAARFTVRVKIIDEHKNSQAYPTSYRWGMGGTLGFLTLRQSFPSTTVLPRKKI